MHIAKSATLLMFSMALSCALLESSVSAGDNLDTSFTRDNIRVQHEGVTGQGQNHQDRVIARQIEVNSLAFDQVAGHSPLEPNYNPKRPLKMTKMELCALVKFNCLAKNTRTPRIPEACFIQFGDYRSVNDPKLPRLLKTGAKNNRIVNSGNSLLSCQSEPGSEDSQAHSRIKSNMQNDQSICSLAFYGDKITETRHYANVIETEDKTLGIDAEMSASKFPLTLHKPVSIYGDSRSIGMLVTSTTGAGANTIDFAQSGSHAAPDFTNADVGRPIEIGGAGRSGGVLTSTITAVLSTTTITVADSAQTAQASVLEGVVIGHDDTAALNQAFAESAIRPLSLACGSYRITGPISLPAGGYVLGRNGNPYNFLRGFAGQSGTSPQPCQMFIADGFSREWDSAAGGIILGGYTHLEGIGIDMQAVVNPPPAIYGKYGWNQIISNFSVGGRYSLQAAYNKSTQDAGWFIWGNDFSTATSSGIRLDNVTDSIISHNWSHGHANSGLDINSSGGISAVGNVLENCLSAGVTVYGFSQNNSLVANKIVNNGAWGIYINSAAGDMTVAANMISYNGFRPDGANWYFAGASTIVLTASGNSYRPGGPGNYQANAGIGATIGAGSTFIEAWPAQARGMYYGDAKSLIQPKLLLSPNNLPGPYLNDSGASNAGVPIGAEYYDASGLRRKRIS